MNNVIENLIDKAAAAEDGAEAMRFSQAAVNAAQARMVTAEMPGFSEDQIKQMVESFLSWPLPSDFNPDGGISVSNASAPIGTNLLNYDQAAAMITHILAGHIKN